MFIPKDYYLTTELAELGGIHIANFSNYYNMLVSQGSESEEMVKYGNCTFINSKNTNTPLAFRKIMANHKFTDLTNKVLYSELKNVMCTQMRDVLVGLKEFNPVEVKIYNKRFIEFDPSFRELLYNKTLYILNPEETEECLKDKSILGFIKLNKKCNLVWYNVH